MPLSQEALTHWASDSFCLRAAIVASSWWTSSTRPCCTWRKEKQSIQTNSALTHYQNLILSCSWPRAIIRYNWFKTSSRQRSTPGLLVLFSSRVWASFSDAVLARMSASSPWTLSSISDISPSVYEQTFGPSGRPFTALGMIVTWRALGQPTCLICHSSSLRACSSWWLRLRRANSVARHWVSNSFCS